MKHCPVDDMIAIIPGGQLSVRVSWKIPEFEDNSGHVEVEQTVGKPPNTSLPEGTHPVLYTATDKEGNYKQCNFKVIVRGRYIYNRL